MEDQLDQNALRAIPSSLRKSLPVGSLRNIPRGVHAAYFYENDPSLIRSLSGFLAQGFASNEVGIAIVTREHRALLEAHLLALGANVPDLKAAGTYIAFDAAETLGLFMRNSRPDPMLFNSLVKPLFLSLAKLGSGVRGFGEMVTVLWREGNIQGAIELERLGTQLCREIAALCPLTLLCAYPAEMAANPGYSHGVNAVHCEHELVFK